MSAFCDPDTTTSTPHASVGRSTTPRPETASKTLIAPWLAATSASARTSLTHAGGRLRLRAEERLDLAAAIRERALDLGGVDLLAPLGLEVHGVGAVGLAQLGPALAELTGRRDDRDVARGQQVGHRRLHRTGPGGREQLHVVARLEHHLEPVQDPRVDLDERGRAVVEDRLRHHLRHGRRERRRARGHEVLLAVDLGHGGWPRIAKAPGRLDPPGPGTARCGAASAATRLCACPRRCRGSGRPRAGPRRAHALGSAAMKLIDATRASTPSRSCVLIREEDAFLRAARTGRSSAKRSLQPAAGRLPWRLSTRSTFLPRRMRSRSHLPIITPSAPARSQDPGDLGQGAAGVEPVERAAHEYRVDGLGRSEGWPRPPRRAALPGALRSRARRASPHAARLRSRARSARPGHVSTGRFPPPGRGRSRSGRAPSARRAGRSPRTGSRAARARSSRRPRLLADLPPNFRLILRLNGG